jgi:hypothetical protein
MTMTEIRAERGAGGRREDGTPANGARPAKAAKKAPSYVSWRRLGLTAALGVLWVLGGCGGGVSGDIGRACMASGRDAASPQLCSCVQGAANQTLSASDQRRASRFFDDPDRAQQTRTSDSSRDEAFWLRYRAFADTAEALCGA